MTNLINKIATMDIKTSSLATTLLVFYLFLSGSFISDLYSGQLKDFIKDNRAVKHSMAYITMLFIVVQVGNVTNGVKALSYSAIAYAWFVLTTKLDLQWNLAIIGLLVIGFLVEKHMFQKELDSNEDPALREKDKKRIRAETKSMKRLIFGSILALTVIGTGFYFSKKKGQYGGSFDVGKFVMNDKTV